MIPVIIGAAVAGATLGSGIGSIFSGKADIDDANAIIKNAQEHYELARQYLKEDIEEVNRLAEIYGKLQIRVKLNTIKRFIYMLERFNQNSDLNTKYLNNLDISKSKFRELKTIFIQTEDFVNKNSLTIAAKGAGAAYIAAQSLGTVSATRFFGLWTTEVAVSELAGAAASKGMLTWLGGGSAAMGGLALGGITLAPALLISGFKIASKGEKALSDAYAFESEVAIEIENIELFQEFLVGVYERIKELGKIVHRLEASANDLLDKIESPSYLYPQEIYLKIHGKEFHSLTLLITALADILKTPVLSEDANKINPKTFIICEKYHTLN